MEEFEQEKSKSQIKRELQALKQLGRELIAMPVKELQILDLPVALFEAIVEAQELTHGALKRQTGYIGSLIAKSDYQAIQQQLAKHKQGHQGNVRQFHQVEAWRDDLLNGNQEIMTLLHTQFDNFDGQYVRQLVRNAKKETAENKSPKSSRLLFKYLQHCQQQL